VKNLFENWRKYLNETELEESRVRDVGQQATEMARKVFEYVKSILDKHPDNKTIEEILGSKFVWHNGPMDFLIRRRGLLGPQQKTRIHFQLTLGPCCKDNTSGQKFWMNGGFASWEFQQKNTVHSKEEGLDYLSIGFRFKYGTTKKELKKLYQDMYMELLETLAHELEHREQGDSWGDKIITSSDSFAGYIGQAHEIEAFARGLYTQAVKMKVSYESLVDELAKFYWELCSREGRFECTKEDIEQFKQSLMDYAEKQLPCAQLLSGEPVNPKACKKHPPVPKKADASSLGKIKTFFTSVFNKFKKQTEG